MSTEQQEKRALLISELATRIFVSSRTICVKDAVARAKAIVDYSWELTRVGPQTPHVDAPPFPETQAPNTIRWPEGVIACCAWCYRECEPKRYSFKVPISPHAIAWCSKDCFEKWCNATIERVILGPVAAKDTDEPPDFHQRHLCTQCGSFSEPHTLIETWEGKKIAWCSHACVDVWKKNHNGFPNYKTLTSQSTQVP